MHAFTVSELIRAPIDRVWAVAGDPTRFPEWMQGVDQVEPPDDGPMEAGARLPITVTDRGQTRTSTLKLVEWDPPHGFAIAAGNDSAGTRYRYRFEPARDGTATRAVLEADVIIQGKWRFFAWLLKKGMKRADGGQLRALARLAAP
ncbi:MAG: SRPBCC family protein [Marivibrio sp.]|uniref:SRPBCC family protein n=1 Tax=Marivibrio sp. TaxID=2039719 RepID=UPI0032EF9C26